MTAPGRRPGPGPTPGIDGPDSAFAAALREALAERGLALDRVRAHLLAGGHDLSIATLSYWQTGRSAPVRRSSIEAIGALEVILRVPRGRLACALMATQAARRDIGQPDGRERIADHTGWLAELDGADAADAAVADLGLTWDEDVDRVVQHDLIVMGPDRLPRRHVTRDVVVARAPGLDRVVVVRVSTSADRYALVSGRLGCRLGRSRLLPAHRLTVAELLLDRRVPEGQAHVMEHEVTLVGPGPMDRFSRAYLSPTREAVIQIRFAPDDLPSWVGADVGSFAADPTYVDTPLRHGVVTLTRHDFPPGQLGLRWRWPERP